MNIEIYFMELGAKVKKTIFGGLLFVGGSILITGAVIANNGMSNILGFPGIITMIVGIVIGISGLQKDR